MASCTSSAAAAAAAAGGGPSSVYEAGPSPKRARSDIAPIDDENVDDQCPPPKPMPKSEIQFSPRCNHRHALTRHQCEAGSAADEPLICDGGCNQIIPPSDPRWSCHPCDFDLCELCLLARSGGAVYLGLLAAEETRTKALSSEVAVMSQRAKAAEQRIAHKEREEKSAEMKASVVAEKRVVEAKLAAADERARAALAEVSRLEAEVVERRQRSKANLEKMYAAQKERDLARQQAADEAAEKDAQLAGARAETMALHEELASTRRQERVPRPRPVSHPDASLAACVSPPTPRP